MKVSGMEVPFCFYYLFTNGLQCKWETLLRTMEKHSDRGLECDECKQLEACKYRFDQRVERDTCCPKCHRWNNRAKVCDKCGTALRSEAE